MIPDEVDIRFWPLRVVVRGNRAISSLRWPIAITLFALSLALGAALLKASINYWLSTNFHSSVGIQKPPTG